jgi:hypothetical protein
MACMHICAPDLLCMLLLWLWVLHYMLLRIGLAKHDVKQT